MAEFQIDEQMRRLFRLAERHKRDSLAADLAEYIVEMTARALKAEFELHKDDCTEEEHLKRKDWDTDDWRDEARREWRKYGP